MMEASKVEHSARYVVGCWWLLAAVVVSAANTPHLGAFEVQQLYVYVQKERDSKPSADNKPDILRGIHRKVAWRWTNK